MCNIRRFYWLRELYEADFRKPGIYGSGRVWANAWDVFCLPPSRGGRGRRAAVDFVVCFGCGGIFSRFFFRLFLSSNAHGLLQVWGSLIYLSTSIYMYILVGRNITNSSIERGNKWLCNSRWIGRTITRDRTQNQSTGVEFYWYVPLRRELKVAVYTCGSGRVCSVYRRLQSTGVDIC